MPPTDETLYCLRMNLLFLSASHEKDTFCAFQCYSLVGYFGRVHWSRNCYDLSCCRRRVRTVAAMVGDICHFWLFCSTRDIGAYQHCQWAHVGRIISEKIRTG